jgi:hypothetical protein
MIFSDLPSPAEAGFAKAGKPVSIPGSSPGTGFFGIMLYPRPRSAAVIAAVVMMVVVMVVVTMGRHEDDAGHHMVMMMVMMVMAHLDPDLGELDLVSRRVGKPCVIGL